MTIRIGNGQGFWGDNHVAPERLLKRASDLDYLTMDYLAEVTMAILGRQDARDANGGYARDFLDVMYRLFENAVDDDVVVVANAGGVNTERCRAELRRIATEQDLDVAIASVSGDRFDGRLAEFDTLEHMFSGEPLSGDAEVVAANAYFGAFPIAKALDRGADVVVTGRVIDAALTMGPVIHEFDWEREDVDRLARAMIAGHLIECGAQVTGGNYLGEWRDVEFESIGFPIADIGTDGTTTITKPAGSAGKVCEGTVSEQLLYEVGDPSEYRGPDVNADFSAVQLDDVGQDRVRVTGVTGMEPSSAYKASLHYRDGWIVRGDRAYSSPDAFEKAQRAVSYLRTRADNLDLSTRRFEHEFFGRSAFHRSGASPPASQEEVVVMIGAEFAQKADAAEFGKLFAPIGLGGPPSGSFLSRGRPKPSPKFSYYPVLVPKDEFEPTVEVVTT
jgi:hypothetical protein